MSTLPQKREKENFLKLQSLLRRIFLRDHILRTVKTKQAIFGLVNQISCTESKNYHYLKNWIQMDTAGQPLVTV